MRDNAEKGRVGGSGNKRETEREKGGRARRGKKERKVAARQEDINSVNAVIRTNPKYRASIKHGSKIIICTG